MIRELDDNISKYAQEKISDKDIVRLSTRIANKELKDIGKLNELANLPSKEAFVKRLENEIAIQKQKEKERAKQFENVLEEFQKQAQSFHLQSVSIEEKSKQFDEKINQVSSENIQKDLKIQELSKQLEKTKEDEKQRKIDVFIGKKIKSWRRISIIPFIICILILVSGLGYFLYQASWDSQKAMNDFLSWQDNLIFYLVLSLGVIGFSFSCKMLYDCHFSHSQIENFKKGLKIPDDL